MADEFEDEDEISAGVLGDDEDEDDDAVDLGLDDEDEEVDELSPEGLGAHGLKVEEEEDPEM